METNLNITILEKLIHQILPEQPLLTSKEAGWKNIFLAYYQHPGSEICEHTIPFHVLETLTAKMINLNGACYHVRYSETGKESVLLIHGWPDDSTVWKYQVTALIENGYRVICPDLLGYGLSEVPLMPNSLLSCKMAYR